MLFAVGTLKPKTLFSILLSMSVNSDFEARTRKKRGSRSNIYGKLWTYTEREEKTCDVNGCEIRTLHQIQILICNQAIIHQIRLDFHSKMTKNSYYWNIAEHFSTKLSLYRPFAVSISKIVSKLTEMRAKMFLKNNERVVFLTFIRIDMAKKVKSGWTL